MWLAFEKAQGQHIDEVREQEIEATEELLTLDEELRRADPAESLDSDDVIAMEQPRRSLVRARAHRRDARRPRRGDRRRRRPRGLSGGPGRDPRVSRTPSGAPRATRSRRPSSSPSAAGEAELPGLARLDNPPRLCFRRLSALDAAHFAPTTTLRDRRPVVVVCSNLSGNCLGRALLLAELVPDDIEARVVGVQLKPEIWKPASGFRRPASGRFIEHAAAIPRGDRLAAKRARGRTSRRRASPLHEPRLTLRAGVPANDLLLDIDDWEVGLYSRQDALAAAEGLLLDRSASNSFWSIRFMDRKIDRCPRRLVPNAWLRRRYGGEILPHVRDYQSP